MTAVEQMCEWCGVRKATIHTNDGGWLCGDCIVQPLSKVSKDTSIHELKSEVEKLKREVSALRSKMRIVAQRLQVEALIEDPDSGDRLCD